LKALFILCSYFFSHDDLGRRRDEENEQRKKNSVPESLSAFCLILDGEFGATTRSFSTQSRFYHATTTMQWNSRIFFSTTKYYWRICLSFSSCVKKYFLQKYVFEDKTSVCCLFMSSRIALHVLCHTQLLLCNNFFIAFPIFFLKVEFKHFGWQQKKRELKNE
jgi:hypothetical protein